ncbi:MAG: hypothetical protein ACRDOY_08730, partial [Nocardioidaceae bacterium]
MNRPEPVDYFNRLRFAEAELYLFVQPDGTVAGTLAFRIEDWYRAHEAAAPGEIERGDHQGVSWFKPGQWVQA